MEYRAVLNGNLHSLWVEPLEQTSLLEDISSENLNQTFQAREYELICAGQISNGLEKCGSTKEHCHVPMLNAL